MAFAGVFVTALAGFAVPAKPLILAHGTHLFLDDRLIAESRGVARKVCPPVRFAGNPIVTGPTDKCFQPYMTVLRNPQTGRYRIWYGIPENASQSHLATMDSADGIHFVRPHRVLKDPSRIDFGASILDEGLMFRDPNARYKYTYWNAGGLQLATSPDGLEWTHVAPGPILSHNHDINNLYWDPIRKRYTANVSQYIEGSGWTGKRRIPHQSTSRDLKTWTSPKPIVVPDKRDSGETQFYCMGGVLARGDLLIGMVRVLRDDLPANPGGPVAGIGYTTLCWSHDGEAWTRDTEPFLDRAPEGAWDRAMAWIDCQLLVGDQVYLYYGGYRQGHKVERFTERQIGLATMKRDRYVARVAGDKPGLLRTPLLRLRGVKLTVNADAAGGELRIQVEDENGKSLRGFSFVECRPIRENGTDIPIVWKRSLSEWKNRPIRLAFRLRAARLFAIGVESASRAN